MHISDIELCPAYLGINQQTNQHFLIFNFFVEWTTKLPWTIRRRTTKNDFTTKNSLSVVSINFYKPQELLEILLIFETSKEIFSELFVTKRIPL